ncbi:hypothetical protein GCM10008171_26610 [Methylopila jiangsuensis]|uniref:Secreted protein n=1 Tax=Methylopila jiangsuensis TaxID=586230 RepID=A0A9W6JI08_9HYPH|nr:hypothetical protein [Methylopila jiangsuensis]MDR6285203.1 hypothetical protein [Methylopila jiangsuensis]GLK77407.1 hypothetical protein GCM10008171_26610 [Methylopila jiangsuensis]
MSRKIVLSLALLAGVAAFAAWTGWSRTHEPRGGAGLSGEGRATFVRAAEDACVAAQGAGGDGAPSREEFRTFCRCYGEAIADAMTPQEVERLSRLPREQILAAQEDQAAEAFQACSGDAREEAGAPR